MAQSEVETQQLQVIGALPPTRPGQVSPRSWALLQFWAAGVSQATIATAWGISPSRVGQLYQKAFRQLVRSAATTPSSRPPAPDDAFPELPGALRNLLRTHGLTREDVQQRPNRALLALRGFGPAHLVALRRVLPYCGPETTASSRGQVAAQARAGARWMADEFARTGHLTPMAAAAGLEAQFGAALVPDGRVRRDVLAAFNALTTETVVWSPREGIWRPRTANDPPGRRGRTRLGQRPALRPLAVHLRGDARDGGRVNDA